MAKGFGKMGGQMGGGMGNMRSQFQNLQKQMMEQQEKIAEMEVTSSVGGGVLKVTMSGDQVCKKVEIDPAEPRYIKVLFGRGYKIEGGKRR